jgi:hypothetical protein
VRRDGCDGLRREESGGERRLSGQSGTRGLSLPRFEIDKDHFGIVGAIDGKTEGIFTASGYQKTADRRRQALGGGPPRLLGTHPVLQDGVTGLGERPARPQI